MKSEEEWQREIETNRHEELVAAVRSAQTVLSRRDEFAKAALAGMLAAPDCGGPEGTAIWAVRYADALIAELHKPAGQTNASGAKLP